MKYSVENIGNLAGVLWKTLEGKDGLTLKEIEKESGEKAADLQLGIGWLFKEDKLEAKKVGRSIKFWLK